MTPIMPPDILRRAGEALHGPRWQHELARALAVDRSTVRRWLAGETPIPARRVAGIVELLTLRRDVIAGLVDEIAAAERSRRGVASGSGA